MEKEVEEVEEAVEEEVEVGEEVEEEVVVEVEKFPESYTVTDKKSGRRPMRPEPGDQDQEIRTRRPGPGN